jgi:hypothetical protein
MLGVLLLYIVLSLRFGPTLEGLRGESFELVLWKIRARLGRVGFCLALAVFMLGIALLYVRLDTSCRYLGGWYALMAENPFDFAASSDVAFRRLTPTISYLVGLTGRNIIVTNLIIAGSLLFAVGMFFTSAAYKLSDAFFAVCAIALSLVTLTTIHCGGYTDSTTYLLIFCMWMGRRRWWVFYPLFFLALLNREAVLFLLPWILWTRKDHARSIPLWLLDVAIGTAVVLIAYYCFREFISSHGEVKYSMKWYLGGLLDDPFRVYRQTLYYHGLATFSVFKLLWAIPILATVACLRKRNWNLLFGFVLIFVGSYLQLFIASDTSRLMTLSFMLLPLSFVYLLTGNQFEIRRWIGWLVLANLAVPTLYTANLTIEIWQPYWRHVLIQLL